MECIFPDEFTWGVSTASYQVEGAWNQDGKGESIWDRFTHNPKNVEDGSSGDIACDHYNRFKEDISLMEDLNIPAYRFSISWPRIFPGGNGEVNRKGIEFYRKLTDELLEKGIEPWACLYHWDLPQALQDKGGWAERSIVKDFENYVETVSRELGDNINRWIVLNEPWVIANNGYRVGTHAPGVSDFDQFLRASNNLQVAQGRAIKTLRGVNSNFKIGTVFNLSSVHPLRDEEKDLRVAEKLDQFLNRWYLDPLFKGKYPPLAEKLGMEPDEDDLDEINQPIDFLGINNYSRRIVAHDPKKPLLQTKPVGKSSFTTEMGWEIYPKGLYELLVRLKDDYFDPVLYVTENGAAFDDKVTESGIVQDDDRICFLRDYLISAWKALKEGADLRGYFVWTLMDNFEWANGYKKRFGLVSVDFETLERVPKKSAYWYKKVIEGNSVESLGYSDSELDSQ